MVIEIGDRVRLKVADVAYELPIGTIGTVIYMAGSRVSADWDNFNHGWPDDKIKDDRTSGWSVNIKDVELIPIKNWRKHLK